MARSGTAADAERHRRPTPDPSDAPGPSDAAGPDRDARRPWPWLVQIVHSWPGQVGLGAVLLGALLHLRYGYAAGQRDHVVLSPVGLQWAHPDWFAGDWAMSAATQPHWLFDVLTWFGSATDTLAAVYLLYWVAALVVFTTTTVLLARAWVPEHALLATVVVIVCSAATPLNFLGSGNLLFATALPNVLGGSLLFLTVAALLLDRRRLAAGAGVATALVHLQHGSVAALLLLAVAGLAWLRARRPDWTLLAGGGAALLVVVVGLRLRAVAGHISDFVEACQLLVPYHCEASSWKAADVRGGVALAGLALLTVFYLPRERRERWLVVVALPTAGLLGGLVADRWNIPTLGHLAQGVNIYRLSLLLLPLTVWGLLTPVLAPVTPRQRWVTLGLVLVLGHSALGIATWGLEKPTGGTGAPWMLVFAGALGLACAVRTVPDLVRTPATWVRVAALGLVVSVLASGVFADELKRRRFDPRIFPQGAQAAWAEQAQAQIEPGRVVLGPPREANLRLLLRRAIVVDCRYAPYGGPAWAEYKARLAALGGISQCNQGTPGYTALSAAALVAAARRYGADFIVLGRAQRGQLNALVDQGWTVVLEPSPRAGFFVLRAPWMQRPG